MKKPLSKLNIIQEVNPQNIFLFAKIDSILKSTFDCLGLKGKEPVRVSGNNSVSGKASYINWKGVQPKSVPLQFALQIIMLHCYYIQIAFNNCRQLFNVRYATNMQAYIN